MSASEPLLLHAALTISPSAATAGPNIPLAWLPHPALSHIYWIKPSPSLSIASHPLSPLHGYIPSVDSGLGRDPGYGAPRGWPQRYCRGAVSVERRPGSRGLPALPAARPGRSHRRRPQRSVIPNSSARIRATSGDGTSVPVAPLAIHGSPTIRSAMAGSCPTFFRTYNLTNPPKRRNLVNICVLRAINWNAYHDINGRANLSQVKIMHHPDLQPLTAAQRAALPPLEEACARWSRWWAAGRRRQGPRCSPGTTSSSLDAPAERLLKLGAHSLEHRELLDSAWT